MKYKNGNVDVTLLNDGTRILFTEDDYFNFERPLSMDIKITNSCDRCCPFCHENSIPNGRHSNINLPFWDSIKPYTEVALGGGNVFEYPYLEELLTKLKNNNVIANITVNAAHYRLNEDKLDDFYNRELIKRVGVSVTSEEDLNCLFGTFIKRYAIIHVINGLFNPTIHDAIKSRHCNLLILGYKDFRRGESFHKSNDLSLNMKWLSNNFNNIVKGYKNVSLDNLAVKQIPQVKNISNWEYLYHGEDGRETGTFYIDAVNEEFALSSINTTRYPIKNTIKEMFDIVKENS